MEFAFSEEQQELAATVRSLLSKRADSAAVRAAMVSETGLRRGAVADAVRADRGGRAGDPGGVRRRRVLAARVDGRAGGGRPLAGALSPARVPGRPPRRCWPAAPTRREAAAAAADRGRRGGGVRRAGSSLRCSPTRPRSSSPPADDGLVELPGAGAAEWLPSMDQTIRLGSVDGHRRDADRRRRRRARTGPTLVGAVGVAALSAGLAARALEMTVAYSQGAGAVRPPDRLVPGAQAPDGRPAGAGRDVPLGVVGGVVRRWPTARPNAERLAHVAKSYCSDALDQVAAETVQLHGGIAITWEHDAQLVFKRAHALAQLFGAAAHGTAP